MAAKQGVYVQQPYLNIYCSFQRMAIFPLSFLPYLAMMAVMMVMVMMAMAMMMVIMSHPPAAETTAIMMMVMMAPARKQ